MRTYYFFKGKDGWFQDTYTQAGELIWVQVTDIKKAYRVSSAWLINHMVDDELTGYEYKVERRNRKYELIEE